MGSCWKMRRKRSSPFNLQTNTCLWRIFCHKLLIITYFDANIIYIHYIPDIFMLNMSLMAFLIHFFTVTFYSHLLEPGRKAGQCHRANTSYKPPNFLIHGYCVIKWRRSFYCVWFDLTLTDSQSEGVRGCIMSMASHSFHFTIMLSVRILWKTGEIPIPIQYIECTFNTRLNDLRDFIVCENCCIGIIKRKECPYAAFTNWMNLI